MAIGSLLHQGQHLNYIDYRFCVFRNTAYFLCQQGYVLIFFDFYCTMLCIARTALSQVVRLSAYLSVCLSHPSILSKMAKRVIKLFLPSGSHTIIVFPYRTLWQYTNGYPLTGASNAGARKNSNFLLISCFIAELIQDKVVVTVECE